MNDFLASCEYGKKRLALTVSGMEIPLWVIKGREKGKTLVVSAALHGDEYIGPLSIQRFFEEADPEKMKGNVILLPLVNRNGFYEGSRLTVGGDHDDLNQSFPGDADGSFGARIAHALSSLLYPLANFILDLHGGSIHEPMVPLLFYPDTVDEKTRETSLCAAREMDVDYILASSAEKCFYSCAAHKGIPALLLEIGGEGGREESLVSRCLTCIKRAIAFLEIDESYERRINPNIRRSDLSYFVTAKSDGFWYPFLSPGMIIKKGDRLGEIRSLQGELLDSIYSECDGIVWYYTKKLGVREGTHLVAYGRLVEGL